MHSLIIMHHTLSGLPTVTAHCDTEPCSPYRFPSPRLHSLAGLSAIAVAAGELTTCAIDVEGGVKCWGSNQQGQLGIGSNENQNLPANVTGFKRDPRERIELGAVKKI